MKDTPLDKLQFNLRSMLLLTAAIGVVLGIGKSLGLPAMIFVLTGLITVFAGLKCGWKSLLASDNGIIWWGAAAATLSVFFTYSYGPMGGAVTYLALCKNIDFSWNGLVFVSILTPFFVAPLVGLGALAALTYQSSYMVSRFRLGVTITAILFATIADVSTIVKFRGFVPAEAGIILHYATSLAVLIATFLVVTSRRKFSKSSWIHILLAVWALSHFYPIPSSGNLVDALAIFGPAYWMLVIGYLAILIGGVLGLWGSINGCPCPSRNVYPRE